MTSPERTDGPPSSARRAPHGWVWRFYVCSKTADPSRWRRDVIDVASRGYAVAATFAKYVAVWRGGRAPLILGVRRVRPAGLARERPSEAFDMRF